MNRAEAEELRLLETGNRAEDALLRAGLQPCLEAHEIPHLPSSIFLPQLNHRICIARQADGFHRTKPKSLDAPLRHLFDGQAALEVGDSVELVSGHILLARDQRRDERLVLFPSERRVPVVVSPALAVARGFEEPAPPVVAR